MAVVVDPAALPQNLTALAKANHVRLKRAELKRDVEAGRTTVRDLIADPPWELGSLPLVALLQYAHRWGRTRALRFIAHDCRHVVTERTTVAGMTERQRRVVIATLWAGECR